MSIKHNDMWILWTLASFMDCQVTRPKASNRTPKEHLSNSSICQAKCRAYLSGALEHLGTAIGTARVWDVPLPSLFTAGIRRVMDFKHDATINVSTSTWNVDHTYFIGSVLVQNSICESEHVFVAWACSQTKSGTCWWFQDFWVRMKEMQCLVGFATVTLTDLLFQIHRIHPAISSHLEFYIAETTWLIIRHT